MRCLLRLLHETSRLGAHKCILSYKEAALLIGQKFEALLLSAEVRLISIIFYSMISIINASKVVRIDILQSNNTSKSEKYLVKYFENKY